METAKSKTFAQALLALLCAVALTLGCTGSALAATYNSPQGTSATDSSSGVSATVDYTSTTDSSSGGLSVNSTTDSVSSADVSGSRYMLASFTVTSWGDLDVTELTDTSVTFNVGSEYAGATVYVYVEDKDGNVEVYEAVVASDGTVTISLDTITDETLISVVVDGDTVTTASSTSSTTTTDSSDTSPQTGVTALPAATVACVAAAGALACAVALRRRVRA